MNDWEEKNKLYLADVTALKDPLIQHSVNYMEHAVSYAQICVKWAFLLNGGALVALPALGSFVSSTDARSTAIYYVVGLILIALCSFLAYINFMAMAQYKENEATRLHWQTLGVYFGNEHNQEKTSESIQLCNKSMDKNLTVMKVTFWFAIVVGLSSYVSFLIGSLSLLN